ncbi:MAG TPA: hypothetical protein PK819_05915, partial [Thermomicrobiales bacterium]|nr:hypothetical protein [Thermomicrobiales bacterium]
PLVRTTPPRADQRHPRSVEDRSRKDGALPRGARGPESGRGRRADDRAARFEEGESTGRGVFRGSRRKATGKKATAAAPAPETAATEAGIAAPATELPAGSTSPLEGGQCPDEFPIKGNAGSLIYHQPGQSSYAPTEAEICFATAEDAEAGGYRASKARGTVSEIGEDVVEHVAEITEAE